MNSFTNTSIEDALTRYVAAHPHEVARLLLQVKGDLSELAYTAGDNPQWNQGDAQLGVEDGPGYDAHSALSDLLLRASAPLFSPKA